MIIPKMISTMATFGINYDKLPIDFVSFHPEIYGDVGDGLNDTTRLSGFLAWRMSHLRMLFKANNNQTLSFTSPKVLQNS
jgi:hypothetical protein